jgi:hypothetical protein
VMIASTKTASVGMRAMAPRSSTESKSQEILRRLPASLSGVKSV